MRSTKPRSPSIYLLAFQGYCLVRNSWAEISGLTSLRPEIYLETRRFVVALKSFALAGTGFDTLDAYLAKACARKPVETPPFVGRFLL